MRWKLYLICFLFGVFGILINMYYYEQRYIPENYVCKDSFDSCYKTLGRCIKSYGELINDTHPNYQDVNEDGKVNCVDIAQTVYTCYKGKNYYTETCTQWNETNAHAFVKVWVNYIPSSMDNMECDPCLKDKYGRCIGGD